MDINILKRYSWQDYALVGGLLIIFITLLSIFSGFQNLDGPLYGGDLYYHFGHINHIVYGGSIFDSSHFLNEYEHYSWLFHLITALFAWIGLGAFKATILVPVLEVMLSGVLTYVLVHKITEDKNIALVSALAWAAIIPANNPTFLSGLLLVPLMILAVFYFKSPIWTGIVYGLCGIGHQIAFFGINMVIAVYVLYKVFSMHALHEKLREFWSQIKHFAIVYVIGVPISLLYWGPLIFVYHGHTLNPWQEYVLPMSGLFPFFLQTIQGTFFNTSTIITTILSLLSIVGLYVAFRFKKYRIFLIPLIVMIVGILHPLITDPLIGTSLGYYGFGQFATGITLMLGSLGLLFIFKNLRSVTGHKNKHTADNHVDDRHSDDKHAGDRHIDDKRDGGESDSSNTLSKKIIIFSTIVLLILVFLSFRSTIVSFKANQWYTYATTSDDSTIAQRMMADYIIKTTNVNDVFLTTHAETAFALNALTGRKVVYMRITHANPFVEINTRIADAASIMYGGDNATIDGLIKKYDVKYFYIDPYSMQTLQQCSQYMQNYTLYDPELSYACMRVTAPYKSLLEKKGLGYAEVNARLNIADNSAPKFDLLIIRENLNSTFLNSYITGTYQTNINNQPAYLLFKVKR